MAEIWAKLDHSLALVYSNYLEAQKKGRAAVGWIDPRVERDAPIGVMLEFAGDLRAIEQRGFATRVRHSDTQADGAIRLADLEAVASLPQVTRLWIGFEPEPFLDLSVPDTKADKVWTLNKVAGTFAGDTGKGVVIGVIDTGIDFLHDFFLKQVSPKETRIQRIWDMGLVRTGTEREPDPARLGLAPGAATYGVEYDVKHINDVLQKKAGALKVRHRDCGGHGTHVAAIAAGDGRKKYDFVGVAPEADLVMVKYLSPEVEPAVVGAQRFKDAVNYILNVAKDDLGGEPVVINCSFGSPLGPHDGLSEEADFLNSTFAAAGRAVVFAAGNSAGRGEHASAAVPSPGSIGLDFKLFDTRPASAMKEFKLCKWKTTTKPLFVQIWYPVLAAPHTLSARFRIPGIGAAVAAPALGGAIESGNVGSGAKKKKYVISHTSEMRGFIDRNAITLTMLPADDKHAVGAYSVELSATTATDVHAWAFQYGRHQGIKFTSGANDRFLVGHPGSAANAITVAAYATEGPDVGKLATFSSRGPLAQYVAGPVTPKPDLAAPGVKIDAAKSRHMLGKPGDKVIVAGASTATVALQGTSMAAPHVAGVVALLLQKKPALTTAQIKTLLKTHFQPPPGGGTAEEWGVGKLDAKAAHTNA